MIRTDKEMSWKLSTADIYNQLIETKGSLMNPFKSKNIEATIKPIRGLSYTLKRIFSFNAKHLSYFHRKTYQQRKATYK